MTRTGPVHRRVRLAAATGALLLALAACSSGTSGGDTSAATTAATSAASSADSSAPTSGESSAPASEGSSEGSSAASSEAPATPASGTFTMGVTSFFLSHLMPGNSGGSNVNNALFTPLTQLDVATSKIVNAVAESIDTDGPEGLDDQDQEGVDLPQR